jgi:MFS family permease
VEWAHFVALGVFAYHHGGTSFVGLAGLVRLLPAGVVAPFAGSLGDRFRRERLLLLLLAVEAGALGGSGAAALADDRVIVLVLAAVVGVTSTLMRPAVQSLLPSLARTSTELIALNGATSTFEGLGALTGPLVVGAIVLFATVGSVFIGAGVSLLVGVAVLFRVRALGPPSLAGAPEPSGPIRRTSAGLRLVAKEPRLRLIIGLAGAQCFVRGCLNVLVVVVSFEMFHAGSSGVGYLNAAIGVGGLLGALAATALSARRLALTFGAAVLLWGAPIAVLAPLSLLGLAILCLAVVGAANAFEDVALITLVQRSTPDDVLASVLGVLWGLAMTAVAIGSIVAPWIVRSVGDRTSLVVVGLVLPVLALVFGRRLSDIDKNVRPTERLKLIEGVPMFAPLSLAMKERVAASLLPVHVRAGETVVRAGELGDRFYIVSAGQLGIERAGVHLLDVGPGDYFGEIALLQDVPRTASVTAVVGSVLYALGRDAFLVAVTGHPAAVALARQVVTERQPEDGGQPLGTDDPQR